MDLPELFAGWKYRKFLRQLRNDQAFRGLDLPGLRTEREYGQLLLELRKSKAGCKRCSH